MGLLSGKYLAGNMLCKQTSQVLSVDMVDILLKPKGDVRDVNTIVGGLYVGRISGIPQNSRQKK